MPRRVIGRLREALPSGLEILAGSLLWAMVMGLNAGGMLWLRGWGYGPLFDVGLLFTAGGLIGFAPALWLGRLIGGTGRAERAVSSHFVCLTVFTVGTTAGFYALQYRHYYAQWHAPAFTVPWCYQVLFTGLVALYQFAALGLRLYFPVGFAAFLLAPCVLAKRPLSRKARFARTASRPLPARTFR